MIIIILNYARLGETKYGSSSSMVAKSVVQSNFFLTINL